MKIRIIGDIHGDYGAYLNILDGGVHDSIQVGDYGKGFVPSPPLPFGSHRFIRGNHDSPRHCEEDSNWIHDGTIENIDGTKFGFIGGAWSIDQQYRIPGVSWWEDEELSYARLDELITKFTKTKPDIMITHDCPMSVTRAKLEPKGRPVISTRTAEALDAIFQVHQPKLWIYGHWHENHHIKLNGTDFICLGINAYLDLETQRP